MHPIRWLLLTLLCTLFMTGFAGAPVRATGHERPVELAVRLFSDDPAAREAAFAAVTASGDTGYVAPIVEWMRFYGHREIAFETLRRLTGDDPGDSWQAWQLWQETHPDIAPIPEFDRFKASLLSQIDGNFLLFLYPEVKHEIRLEEVVWGGVLKDGIPALTDPALISPAEAEYLQADELVFGVAINGDARAYPLRIMDWHEMFNDVIGGVPVALAYCTLCGSGILFETKLEDRSERMLFGSSGLLYRSNKLMYDRGTNSLWNQFTGRPVVGPLTGSGIELKVRPVVISSWAEWLRRHPGTRVLSLDTGHDRDYRPGRPYGAYFASSELMFPAAVTDESLRAKDHVFVLRLGEEKKAWPLAAFAGGAVLNDTFAGRPVVLIGNEAERSVRAYWRGFEAFSTSPAGPDLVEGKSGRWRMTEEALIGPDGSSLERIGGHIGYWFAYQNFLEGAPLAARQ